VASEVDICNRALGKLGAATIISLDDDDPKAVALKIAYPAVRDKELRQRRWRFALERAQLVADAVAPVFGFTQKFPLPADCLRVIQIGQYDFGPNLADYRSAPTELWSIEGRAILTSISAPLPIRYIKRVEDTGLFDAAFTEAFASRLGYETCYRITQSNEREDRCMRDYSLSIGEARRSNALEVAPNEPTDDTWVMARLG
jgi:hypothetical protein